MSISTAPVSATPGLAIVTRTSPVPKPPTSLSAANCFTDTPDLTIHRVTRTHHGRTLLMLGHAAEYLADSRRFSARGRVIDSDNEAIHILMGLSRTVFDEYAGGTSKGWRLDRLVLGCLTHFLN
jgi:hypothetical protein